VKHRSFATLRERLIAVGGSVVRHTRYTVFQMAEVAIPWNMFIAILERIRLLWLLTPYRERDDGYRE
jgi:hypothetical protein